MCTADVRNVGDEKLIRQEGLHISCRSIIKQQVEIELEKIRSPAHLALWVALMEYYLSSVYPLAIRSENGRDIEVKGMPTWVCERLVEEWTRELNGLSANQTETERMVREARDSLSEFSDEIPKSIEDVYQYEVNLREVRSKRVLKREVLLVGWDRVDAQSGGAMPPVCSGNAFFVAVNGRQTGPHSSVMLRILVVTGQFTPQSLVWCAGMATWMPANQVAGLQGVLELPPSLQN
jgi:hypothetical protein